MITNEIIGMFSFPIKEPNESVVKKLLIGVAFQILNPVRFTQVNSENFLCCTGDCRNGCRKLCSSALFFVVEDVKLRESSAGIEFSLYLLKLKIGEEILYMTHRTFLSRLKGGDIKELDTPDCKSCS